MEQAMIISNLIIIVVSIIAIILPRYIPEHLILPDKNRYIIKEPNLFRRTKEKQLSVLGLYFFLVGFLSFLNIKTSFIKSDNLITILNILFYFLIPFFIITKTEQKLKTMYLLRD
ncbi:hypothetical protein [Senegalia massiliensis]|uniref:SdpI family protein n=1 Tax=Senegalia massiliensis TaxID=1720316 RepID=A0A845QZE5_9CLOT|nr:hypothetical protein [Senegalia massiliensis]NBI08327.1 hypothetical protein [Senegalia massiliensis]